MLYCKVRTIRWSPLTRLVLAEMLERWWWIINIEGTSTSASAASIFYENKIRAMALSFGSILSLNATHSWFKTYLTWLRSWVCSAPFFKTCALLYAALLMTRHSSSRWWCGCYSAACWSSCTLMSAFWYRPARTSPGWGMKTLHWLPEWEAAVSAPQVLLALVLQVCPHSSLSSAQLLEVLQGNRSVLICLLPVCSQQWWHDPHQSQYGQLQCRVTAWWRLSTQQEDDRDATRQPVRAREAGYSKHPSCTESRGSEDVCQVIKVAYNRSPFTLCNFERQNL